MREGRAGISWCRECWSVERPDGWLVHKTACSVGRLPKDAQRRITAKCESVDEARRRAMEGATGYVIR